VPEFKADGGGGGGARRRRFIVLGGVVEIDETSHEAKERVKGRKRRRE